MKFRNKPVVIEAMLNNGDFDNAKEIIAWAGAAAGPIKAENGDRSLSIYTLEGVMRADEGDWIIKGVKGEFYPCKPGIFAETYEPV